MNARRRTHKRTHAVHTPPRLVLPRMTNFKPFPTWPLPSPSGGHMFRSTHASCFPALATPPGESAQPQRGDPAALESALGYKRGGGGAACPEVGNVTAREATSTPMELLTSSD
ncbi:hypothetical protein EYF80_056646 [Liparis tanakae]|uniref:Uncharacterized protein n=1 Tax=Liparis tanakae TaxID=230148 RepID=A0A4Z2EWC7_9TELE|nr:hypothetical protein EYF80_056646 [Liparis tanakae]